LAPTEVLRLRASKGLQRIAFYVVPSFVAFVLLGDVLIAALFQTGRFDAVQTALVYAILIAFSIGLLASTGTRLLSSTFFALRDTRTPAKYALVRVVAAAILAIALMIQFEPIDARGLQIPAGIFGGMQLAGQPLGAVGLAAGSGIAAWIEWALLRRSLRRRLGTVGAGAGPVARMFVAALVAAAAGWGTRLLLPPIHPTFDLIIEGVAVFSVYGLVYFAVAAVLRLEEIQGVATRVRRMTGR
jgi:putative peptidoglycan lipid II flippase